MTTSSKRRWPPYRFLVKRLLHEFVVPTNRLLLLAAAGVVPLGTGYALGAGTAAFWGWNGLLLALGIADVAMLPRRRHMSVQRLMPERADLGQPFEVELELKCGEPRRLHVELADDLPLVFGGALIGVGDPDTDLDTDPDRARTPVLCGRMEAGRLRLRYETYGGERGTYHFAAVGVRYSGGLGLWKKQARLECPGDIRIYPDMSRVRGVLGSMQAALVLDGNRHSRRQRGGSEFESIRDYQQGDDVRHIHWQATARTAKLMTSVWQPERGKTVTLLLDCGRRTGTWLDGQTKLDRALEAALTLAAVALKQGDSVSLAAFSGSIKLAVPADKGLRHLHTLTEAVFDLRSEPAEANYGAVFSHVLQTQKKRSLLVLFSDMESYLHDRELAAYALRLRRSHSLLLLSLSDPLLHGWSRVMPDSSRTAYIRSAAAKFTADRRAYVQKMAGQGIPVLDVPADRLALSAVNAYLDLKAKDAL
ncbi:hypothetical protein SD70_28850 [Gordoniibacillus kamchatkensis]|uniref:DUF58 domain-containing protein n=1 Tax=Gordoniibacillus kamchatkensis TaxID=1590651 RepID=A0ABR5ABS3_9BACL|nr:DUF58 domain-containing protein [Paenibacillus sp. VKM B-2647]KIL38050.1 hypothetical protein SD70_28850 [Paenibacillus sp. VKM B-2647]